MQYEPALKLAEQLNSIALLESMKLPLEVEELFNTPPFNDRIITDIGFEMGFRRCMWKRPADEDMMLYKFEQEFLL